MMRPAVGQQDRLFYESDLEERTPDDHLLRRIDSVLDLSWLRAGLAPFYSHTGYPSVGPELMVRMLLIDYCYSIRSERRLSREVSSTSPIVGSAGSASRTRCLTMLARWARRRASCGCYGGCSSGAGLGDWWLPAISAQAGAPDEPTQECAHDAA